VNGSIINNEDRSKIMDMKREENEKEFKELVRKNKEGNIISKIQDEIKRNQNNIDNSYFTEASTDNRKINIELGDMGVYNSEAGRSNPNESFYHRVINNAEEELIDYSEPKLKKVTVRLDSQNEVELEMSRDQGEYDPQNPPRGNENNKSPAKPYNQYGNNTSNNGNNPTINTDPNIQQAILVNIPEHLKIKEQAQKSNMDEFKKNLQMGSPGKKVSVRDQLSQNVASKNISTLVTEEREGNLPVLNKLKQVNEESNIKLLNIDGNFDSQERAEPNNTFFNEKVDQEELPEVEPKLAEVEMEYEEDDDEIYNRR